MRAPRDGSGPTHRSQRPAHHRRPRVHTERFVAATTNSAPKRSTRYDSPPLSANSPKRSDPGLHPDLSAPADQLTQQPSAGRHKGNSTGKGNPWLAGALGEVVAGVSRTNTFLGERYRRLTRRRGKKRAIVALGNSVLTIVWQLLSDPNSHYQDLGPNYYESKINQQRRQRDLIRQLEHLTGQKVAFQPPPDLPTAA